MSEPWAALDLTPVQRPPPPPPARMTLADGMTVVACCAVGTWAATSSVWLTATSRVAAAVYMTAMMLVPTLRLGHWTFRRRDDPPTPGERLGLVPALAPVVTVALCLFLNTIDVFWIGWLTIQGGASVAAVARLVSGRLGPTEPTQHGWLDTAGCLTCLAAAAALAMFLSQP